MFDKFKMTQEEQTKAVRYTQKMMQQVLKKLTHTAKIVKKSIQKFIKTLLEEVK